MSHLLKNLIIALGISLVLFGIYAFTIGKSDDVSVSETEETGSSQNEVGLRIEKILSDTSKLGSYKIDGELFNDVRFTTLKDYRVKIEDVGTGRANPFNPVQ